MLATTLRIRPHWWSSWVSPIDRKTSALLSNLAPSRRLPAKKGSKGREQLRILSRSEATIEKPHRHADGVGEGGDPSGVMTRSAEADLGQDALTGEQFGAQADHEAHHGQTAIPGLSEVDEAEASCVVRHGL